VDQVILVLEKIGSLAVDQFFGQVDNVDNDRLNICDLLDFVDRRTIKVDNKVTQTMLCLVLDSEIPRQIFRGSIKIGNKKSSYYLIVVIKGSSTMKLSNDSFFLTLRKASSGIGEVVIPENYCFMIGELIIM
jgi:hypothetical protein